MQTKPNQSMLAVFWWNLVREYKGQTNLLCKQNISAVFYLRKDLQSLQELEDKELFFKIKDFIEKEKIEEEHAQVIVMGGMKLFLFQSTQHAGVLAMITILLLMEKGQYLWKFQNGPNLILK